MKSWMLSFSSYLSAFIMGMLFLKADKSHPIISFAEAFIVWVWVYLTGVYAEKVRAGQREIK